jgi:2-keto-3-deoxy-L-rhamnonate aldolase RhmA
MTPSSAGSPTSGESRCLKARMKRGELLHGLFCFTPSTLIIEFIAHAGFDFVIIDTEHSLISSEDLDHMIVAARSAGLSALVRIPLERSYLVAPVLDAGAEGIVFPRVTSIGEAGRAAALCRYAPEGERGLSVHRHIGYRTANLAEENRQVNAEVLVAVMIEDQAGVDACEAIARVPGVDTLVEGAADLSAALGVPWQTRHPRVREALSRVADAAASAGVSFCAIPRVPDDYGVWRRRDVSLFVLGTDRGVIRKGLAEHRETFVGDG